MLLFLPSLASATALRQSFTQQLRGQITDDHFNNLSFGTGDQADYEDLGLAPLSTDCLTNLDGHEEAVEFITDDNGALIIKDHLDGVEYFKPQAAGTWKQDSQKSGVARTYIPAYELVTETYTEDCEEGQAVQCYESKAEDSTGWYLFGTLDQNTCSLGFTEGESNHILVQGGYSDEYSKACGNTAPLDGQNAMFWQQEIDPRYKMPVDFAINTSELKIETSEQLSETMNAEVKEAVRAQISDMVSEALVQVLGESIRGSIKL
jgi:hypothetical protein